MIIDSGLVTGSLQVIGNTTMTGSLSVTGDITGNIKGNAVSATSASYAVTSSYALFAATPTVQGVQGTTGSQGTQGIQGRQGTTGTGTQGTTGAQGATGSQGALTLTTTGTSGAATLTGNVLNIPQYSGGGGGGGGSTPVKLTSQTLTAVSWTLVGSYYTYTFSDVNVTTTCDVSVTPQNSSYLTAYNAQVLPFVGVAAGVVTFYSQFPPQADMVVDIVITQTT